MSGIPGDCGMWNVVGTAGEYYSLIHVTGATVRTWAELVCPLLVGTRHVIANISLSVGSSPITWCYDHVTSHSHFVFTKCSREPFCPDCTMQLLHLTAHTVHIRHVMQNMSITWIMLWLILRWMGIDWRVMSDTGGWPEVLWSPLYSWVAHMYFIRLMGGFRYY